jgi:hypothetical protein
MAIQIKDAGGCISISIDGNTILLNKPQVSTVEVIKDDTIRIDMGQGALKNIFIKYTDVTEPVGLANVSALRNAIRDMLVTAAGAVAGDDGCACAEMIQATTTEVINVKSSVNAGNTKLDTINQSVAVVSANIGTANQLLTDNQAATVLKLVDIRSEVVNAKTSINAGNTKLDTISLSVTGVSTNIAATNQLLTDNQVASLQKLVDIKTEVVNAKTSINAGNTKLDTISVSVAGVATNVGATNQLITDNQVASIQKLVDIKTEVVNAKASIVAGNTKLDTVNLSVAGVATNVGTTNQLITDNQVASIQKLVDIKTEVVNAKASIIAGNTALDTLNQSMSGVSTNVGVGNQILTSLDGKIGNNGFLGNTSTKLKAITLQPVISTFAYAVGQVIGGVMTLTGALRAAALTGTWMGVQIVEKSIQKATIDIVIFSQNPSAANFVDHTAPTWTADYQNIISVNNVATASYSTLSTSSAACNGNLFKKVFSTTGNLYAVAICQGTPTYISASHLYFTFFFEQD